MADAGSPCREELTGVGTGENARTQFLRGLIGGKLEQRTRALVNHDPF